MSGVTGDAVPLGVAGRGAPAARRPRVGRVAILGAGQCGTMVGGALLRAGAPAGVDEVWCHDLDPSVAAESVALGGAGRALASPEEALDADAIVLAAPVTGILELLHRLGPSLRPHTLVVDVAGAKLPVVAAMRDRVPEHAHAVGGHPMAGTERGGPSAARPELLSEAAFVLTEVRDDPEGLARARALVEATGARAVVMDPAVHDRVVARTSHVPHLAAFALALVAGELVAEHPGEVRALLGGGYRGATRLAVGDPDAIAEFVGANASEVLAALGELGAALERLRSALEGGDDLRGALAAGRISQERVLGERRR